MNKKIILGFVIIWFLFGCKTKKGSIQIIVKKTNFPITLRLSRKYKKIIGIKFPKKIEIKNNSITKKAFSKIGYEYNSVSKERSYGVSLYNTGSKLLKKISNNSKKEISPFNNKEYIFYTRHFVDSISSIQNQLKPYVEKMIKLNKDTLHIGTVQEFKKKHKDLLKTLTKNDSISILFSENGKSTKRISIPVNW